MLHLARNIPACPHRCLTPHEHSVWLMLVLQDGMPQIQFAQVVCLRTQASVQTAFAFGNTILKQS